VKVNCEGVLTTEDDARCKNIKNFFDALLNSTEKAYFDLRQPGSYNRYREALEGIGDKVENAFKKAFRGLTPTEIESQIIPQILKIKWDYKSPNDWEEALLQLTKKTSVLFKRHIAFVFFIDEFGYLKHVEDTFWLRLRNTLQSQDCPFLFIVSGSQGLRQMNNPVVFREFRLKFGLDEEESKRLLEDGLKARNCQIERDALTKLLDFTNCNAMYLQMSGDVLLNLGKKVISIRDIDEAIGTKGKTLVNPHLSAAFDSLWRKDILKYYPSPTLARKILRIIASKQTIAKDTFASALGNEDAEIVDETISDLKDNFFIEQDDQNQLIFVDNAFRSWINQNHPLEG
jgi:hypothetical protein